MTTQLDTRGVDIDPRDYPATVVALAEALTAQYDTFCEDLPAHTPHIPDLFMDNLHRFYFYVESAGRYSWAAQGWDKPDAHRPEWPGRVAVLCAVDWLWDKAGTWGYLPLRRAWWFLTDPLWREIEITERVTDLWILLAHGCVWIYRATGINLYPQWKRQRRALQKAGYAAQHSGAARLAVGAALIWPLLWWLLTARR